MMKTKKLYQAPLTERNVVELEGEFCGSVMENKTNAVEIEGHTVGEDYNFDGGTSGTTGNGGEFGVTWQ